MHKEVIHPFAKIYVENATLYLTIIIDFKKQHWIQAPPAHRKIDILKRRVGRRALLVALLFCCLALPSVRSFTDFHHWLGAVVKRFLFMSAVFLVCEFTVEVSRF